MALTSAAKASQLIDASSSNPDPLLGPSSDKTCVERGGGGGGIRGEKGGIVGREVWRGQGGYGPYLAGDPGVTLELEVGLVLHINTRGQRPLS